MTAFSTVVFHLMRIVSIKLPISDICSVPVLEVAASKTIKSESASDTACEEVEALRTAGHIQSCRRLPRYKTGRLARCYPKVQLGRPQRSLLLDSTSRARCLVCVFRIRGDIQALEDLVR
jgi:hypothetical protein